MTDTRTQVSPQRTPRGLNKSYYHYLVYDGDVDESRYYFTLKDISKEYSLCRATINSMINNPDRPCRKYPNVKIFKDKKHRLVVDYNVEEQDLFKWI